MRARDLERYRHEIGWKDAPLLEPAMVVPSEPSPESGDLESLAREAASCTRCRLSEQRRNVVVGEGDPAARVMFVGEGPGAEEDRTGRPFVGQAGALLDAMIFALGLERRQVYIANVVKCRPPGNRDPQDDEVAACASFLDRQIALIQPRVIVALGKPAARRLTGSAAPIGALRGRWSSYLGVPVLPMLVVTILWLTPLFDGLPQATLAAVIIGSIYRLIDVREFRRLYRIDRHGDFALAVLALAGVLLFGALGGIAIAVIASLAVLLAKLYRPEVMVLGRTQGGETDEDFAFRNVVRHPESETFPGLVIVRFGGELFFANATYLRANLRRLVVDADPPVKEVILDASSVPRIDTTAADVLRDLVDELERNGTTLVIARSRFVLRSDLERFGLLDGRIELGDSVAQAVARYLALTDIDPSRPS